MKIKCYYLLLFLLLSIIYSKFSFAQIYQKNQLIELQFTSTEKYNNPTKDVTLECIITNNIDTLNVYGFWDGDNIFKVRFSLDTIGKWIYKTNCSNQNDFGLNNKSGNITISEYYGNNLLYKKGRIKVSPSKRYLIYDNGDPFFYLGDTAWEITWKSYKEQVLQYISDRKSKGFSVIQVVAFSHQLLYPYGIKNRYNETSFLNNNYMQINPRYFDYLDFIVQTANDSGLVICLVSLWAAMSEVNYNPLYHAQCLSKEESLNLAKYIGARYSGYNIFWIIGGDNTYDTPERKEFWSLFANTIRKGNGNKQLCTCHPSGWSSSFDYFDSTAHWLDFHMYQSSHTAGGDYTWKAALNGYNILPTKPVINGEPNYEDIYNNLWMPGDTTQLITFRIRPIDVRQASYESILSGALVGITYGANGVWQWHTEYLPGSHLPRFTVMDAIKMQGSNNMTIVRKVMEKYKWYSFKPRQELIQNFHSTQNFIPIAENNEYCLIYFPSRTDSIVLSKAHDFLNRYSFWINPINGDSLKRGYHNTNTISPPDTNDWILVVDKNNFDISNIKWFNLDEYIKYSNNFPNPFNSKTKISFVLNKPCYITIKIYDIFGKEVFEFSKQLFDAGLQSVTWEPKNLSSGVYFYELKSDLSKKYGKMLLIK